jgi:hypothetical protein
MHGGGEKIVQGICGGGSLKERDHSEDRGVDGNGIRMDRREIGWGVWSRYNWLRIETGGGLL